MKKKELEAEIKLLHEEILGLALSIEGKCLKTDSARKRDYIVRTDYLGKLTHKQLKEDFKKDIETTLCDIFSSICNKILNYEFYDKEQHINILEGFHKILKDYEIKQIVIDTYGEKAIKK